MIVFAEEDLIRAGRIRASLGITHGQTEESALFYRDKIKMKNKLREAGVKVFPHKPFLGSRQKIDL